MLNTLLGEPLENQEPDETLTEQIIFVKQVQALGWHLFWNIWWFGHLCC